MCNEENKVYKMMGNNSTNKNNTSNHSSPQLTEHKRKDNKYIALEIQVLA